MKRYLIALLALLPSCAFAQVTPNLQLNLPADGSSGWGTLMRQNFSLLDGFLSGVQSVPMITLSGAITNANQAATKAYVDAHSSGLTLTTTGTSGPATLTGNTLNIPQYAGTQVYPGAGVAVSTGSAWGTSLTLATVATSGSYTDLSNKPTIPAAQVSSDWNSVVSPTQILNKPTIPAAQVNSDWNASSGVAQILNKPTIPGQPTTVVIAANNSPLKAKADVVCTGTNDDVCINNAITTYCPNSHTSVAGCDIALEDGIYNTGASVVIDNDDVTLRGLHHCMWGGIGPNLSNPGVVGLGCAQIKASATGFPIIQVENNNLGGNGGDTNRHRGIDIRWLYLVGDNYSSDAFLESDGGDNVHITDNVIQKTNDGIVAILDSGVISDNSIQDIGLDAITINPGSLFVRVIHNLLFDDPGNAVINNGVNSVIAQNVVGDLGQGGIINFARSASVVNNQITSMTGAAISLIGAPNSTVTGNTIDFTSGGYAANGKMPTPYDAIKADAASGGSSITGNSLMTSVVAGGYAINAAAATGSTVVGNAVTGTWGSGVTLNLGSIANAANAFTTPTLNPPASITSATIVARYQASSITGITSGNPITTWPDSSGVGRPLTIIAGTGPLYESTSNVHNGPGVRFNGTNQAMGITTAAFNQNAVPKTIFLVASFSATAAGRGANITPISAPGALAAASAFFNSTGNTICEFSGPINCGTQTVTTTNTAHVIEWVFNGGSSRVSVDGSSSSIGGNLPTWNVGLIVGADGGLNGEWFPGDMAEINFFDGAATTTDAATVGAALCTAYGVTCGSSW